MQYDHAVIVVFFVLLSEGHAVRRRAVIEHHAQPPELLLQTVDGAVDLVRRRRDPGIQARGDGGLQGLPLGDGNHAGAFHKHLAAV
ncbi:hypothetical protein D3C80_1180780 [compost metagenome]